MGHKIYGVFDMKGEMQVDVVLVTQSEEEAEKTAGLSKSFRVAVVAELVEEGE